MAIVLKHSDPERPVLDKRDFFVVAADRLEVASANKRSRRYDCVIRQEDQVSFPVIQPPDAISEVFILSFGFNLIFN